MSDLAGRIYIGTSGWSYPKGEGTWNGYFYPSLGRNNTTHYYWRYPEETQSVIKEIICDEANEE
jgi:uncharacterized protein YecE (DUF72 family)